MTKPGFTTSEWWSTLATQILALVALLHPGFDAGQWQPEVSAIAILAAAIASGVYALGRSQVKVAAAVVPPVVATGGGAPQAVTPAVPPPVVDPAPAPVPTTPEPILPPAA